VGSGTSPLNPHCSENRLSASLPQIEDVIGQPLSLAARWRVLQCREAGLQTSGSMSLSLVLSIGQQIAASGGRCRTVAYASASSTMGTP
jgi:hypothetical protein